MDFYFIRHGQSQNNALYASGQPLTYRTHDPELTDLGRRQAALLAESLARGGPSLNGAQRDEHNHAGFGLTHLYTSLMVRAVATGAIVAERLGLPLLAWVDWHEEGGLFLETEPGVFEEKPGHGRGYFAREYPALRLPESLTDAGWWGRGLEPAEERPQRARRVVAELLARHAESDDRVAVISHGGFYNHFVAALQEVEPPYRLHFHMNNTGIARIHLTPRGRHVVYQNRCEHLPAELITY
jgi:2,3-bisphosphoglycerate-dependent phosphoglycerate mutase